MAFRIGPVTFGSPWAEQQAGVARGAVTDAARGAAGMAGQAGQLYATQMPAIFQRLQGELGRTPGYFSQQADLQRRDITEGLRLGSGSALANLVRSGNVNSSLAGSVMAAPQRAAAEALARIAPEMGQRQDARTMSILQALAALAQGSGNMAMSGYGQAGQLYGQAGAGWDQAAANSMAPFNALMGALGYAGGSALGANPALAGRGVNALGRGAGGAVNWLASLFAGGRPQVQPMPQSGLAATPTLEQVLAAAGEGPYG